MELTVPVTLRQPNLLGRLAPAWSTLLFVVSLLVLSGYVVWRKPGPATNALMILASGLAASTLPVLLGLPVVSLLEPAQHWLYLLLTQAVYLTAWAAGLTFADCSRARAWARGTTGHTSPLPSTCGTSGAGSALIGRMRAPDVLALSAGWVSPTARRRRCVSCTRAPGKSSTWRWR
jgi:hypothetical protein